MAEKIIGNIVGVPNPKSDWNQTDPTKADYIKNAPKEVIERLNAEVATRLNVKIGYEDMLDTYTDACGGYSVWYIARQYSSFPYVNNFVPYFLYVSKERYTLMVGDTSVTKDVIVQTKIVRGRICRREKDQSGSIWSEWKEVYATKEEIGDRSQLIDSPNDDLVTAINNAYDIANSASRDANQAQNTADDAKITADSAMYDVQNIVSGELPAARATLSDEASIAYKADADGFGNLIHTTYATKAEVGDIETALDGIIAIQNTLMGGDGV